MNGAHLFRLGMDLETGATHEGEIAIRDRETTCRLSVVPNDAPAEKPRDVMDEDRDDHFIRRGDKVFAGTHLIIEVVRGEGLDDEDRIQQAFRDCVDACGATLLHIHTHKFSPQGVSGVAVLAESHISVHTWPEIGYGAFDVFMCGDAQPWKAVEILRAAFDAEEMRVKELLRGDGLVA
ncbi:MAG: adenosylmethionine decarboxylase [Rhodobacteraceae bacterium]|nr:MAG: adenosylmethionine decarboxylase [Paracoccaceae bacterium]